MPTEDLRAVLEGNAYGDDPRVTPGDRLRALDQLRHLEGDTDAPTLALAREVAALTDGELDRQLAAYLVVVASPPEVSQRPAPPLDRQPQPQQRAPAVAAGPDPPPTAQPRTFAHVEDDDLRRRMERAAQDGENPFDVPGAV